MGALWCLPPLPGLVGQKKAKLSPFSSSQCPEIETHLQVRELVGADSAEATQHLRVLQEPVHGGPESSPSVSPSSPDVRSDHQHKNTRSGRTQESLPTHRCQGQSWSPVPLLRSVGAGICTYMDIHVGVYSLCVSLPRSVKPVLNTGLMCAHTSDTIGLIWHFALANAQGHVRF